MNSAPSPAKQIFLDAVEKFTPDQWPGYLEEACGEDAALRRRVEVLLEAHLSDASLLDEPAIEIGSTIEHSPIAERPGVEIGPYKLLEQIGEGGFGVVFLAEQTRPVRREVALKVVKAGMDTKDVVARFEGERQALAMMDHPNIAKVLEAGTTESGRPYFVMELVKGIPITHFCDDKQLSLRQRLELFKPVCEAVQHAHQKSIIHRDIKPTNVLVAEYDNIAIPKVIDFGVAKATLQKLTELSMFTEFGQVIGTVEYMSPEQAKLNQLDIDTRSDIYSLGVLLYELLTGSTPFERQRLREAAFDEVLRIIREEEPPKPSTRLGTSDALLSIAANRHTEPARLNKEVSGELDWIVMKCLEKDRNRRYETSNGLAMDLQYYLNDEAVQACPPSAAYRLRKFARRNKAAIISASVLAAAIFLGLVGTTWQAIRATNAERATQDERDRAIEAERHAKTEAAIAEAVNEFLNQDLLQQANPEWTPYDRYNEPTGDLKLRTVLDRAAASLDGRFVDQPLVEAALRHTIGDTYAFLGNNDLAALHLQRAVELRVAHLGKEHPSTLASLTNLAFAKGDLELMTRVVDISRRVLGKNYPDTLYWMFSLALATRCEGEQSQDERCKARAIELFRETLEAQRSALGEDNIHTAWTMHCLAHTLVMYAGKAGIPPADDREIESLYRCALAVFRKNGREASWNAFDITLRFGEFLNSRGRYHEADDLLQDALRQLEALPGASPEKVAQLRALLEEVRGNWRKREHETDLEGQRSSEKREQNEPQVENE